MNYWLVKSEPDVFSFDQLLTDGSARWDGVRNYQARNNLRAMQVGDLCLYYHRQHRSGDRRHRPRTHSILSRPYGGKRRLVRCGPGAFQAPEPHRIPCRNKSASCVATVRTGAKSRLSVMPATSDEFFTLLTLSETEL
jgi:predicted RNA-binding protein with PUA-like domain